MSRGRSWEISAGVVALALAACSRAPPPPPPPFSIEGLPVTMKLEQRSTTSIPGSNERLAITIDDITRDQVMVSIRFAPSETVLGPLSARAGDSHPFECGGSKFRFRVAAFDGSLLGTDFATIVIEDEGTRLTESAKIDALIGAVERLEGATFLRNGEEHPASAAADHLRRKLPAAGGSSATAETFIVEAATKSSVTGRPYEIRFADGRVVPLAEFLRGELARLDAESSAR
jgi:Family of unknown function (DUF5329)